jgi:site-specific DNA-methyltransferase (adenine-specific)
MKRDTRSTDGKTELSLLGVAPVTNTKGKKSLEACGKFGSAGVQHSGRHGGLGDIGENPKEGTNTLRGHTDTGGASRFFPCFKYCPKPSRAEREQGCENLPRKSAGECTDREDGTAGLDSPRAGAGRTSGARNDHPTVKASELMCWLIRLICPAEGTVLDPFMGSGTTGIAAHEESCSFIGIEIDESYFKIAEARINDATKQGRLF